jgi:polyribonucleotide nucleotidyltransferase
MNDAPRTFTIQINPEHIGRVIGKSGETIRSLEADHEVQIDIKEDGTIPSTPPPARRASKRLPRSTTSRDLEG